MSDQEHNGKSNTERILDVQEMVAENHENTDGTASSVSDAFGLISVYLILSADHARTTRGRQFVNRYIN